jgi:hypothetical protein
VKLEFDRAAGTAQPDARGCSGRLEAPAAEAGSGKLEAGSWKLEAVFDNFVKTFTS